MELVSFLPLIAIAALFWLLIIRPAQRRQKAMMNLQSSIGIGDEVMLTSGFYGTVSVLHDDRVEVELAPGTIVTVARGAIGSVVTPEGVVDHPDTPASYDDVDPHTRESEDR